MSKRRVPIKLIKAARESIKKEMRRLLLPFLRRVEKQQKLSEKTKDIIVKDNSPDASHSVEGGKAAIDYVQEYYESKAE